MKKQLLIKEMEVVLLCAGNEISTAGRGRLKRIAERGVDWDLVVRIALKHGLCYFLYKNLKRICPELVPEDNLSQLQAYYFQNSKRNLFFCANLVKIVALLKEQCITAVPFKGPVQSEYLYKDIGLRSYTDLDILVKKEDAVKARDLFIENGFTTDVYIPDNQLNNYLDKENFFNLKGGDGSIVIDLHWEITGRYSLHPLYMNDLEGYLESVKLVGQDILSLSCEDMLIQLCIHGTSHCWDKMEMVCSVAEIVKSTRIDDWNSVIRRATKFKCKRMVYLGLLLAENLLDIVLPGEIATDIINDIRIKKLSKRLTQNILKEEIAYTESLSWRFSPTHFLVRDNIPDTFRYLLRLWFRPTVREWIEYPLPDSLLFFYYVLRPYRLIKDGLRGKNA